MPKFTFEYVNSSNKIKEIIQKKNVKVEKRKSKLKQGEVEHETKRAMWCLTLESLGTVKG